MLLSLPRSLAPTHRWEMTHTYFSGVSACSECNLSCLHAEAKSALCSISALRPSLSLVYPSKNLSFITIHKKERGAENPDT